TTVPVDFNRDVRPILSDNCFTCHGPARRRGGLRLDRRASVLEGAVVPGSRAKSVLYERITANDEAERMPPATTGKRLTPAQVEAFLADRRPDAYERVVDRLLTSPHYGERMAHYWLDLARYADTNGYRLDNHRDMWRWRDWVIDAFNQNLPFDQFTLEQ